MDNKKWLHSQFFILGGYTLIVICLAGSPLLMLLYGSRRSAPIGEPGATYTIQNYIVPLVPLLVLQTQIGQQVSRQLEGLAHLVSCGAARECRDDAGTTLGRDRFLLRERGATRWGLVMGGTISESMEKAR